MTRRAAARRRNGSLTIVGTGLRLGSHVTLEALQHIQRADQVFFLVGDPATADWLVRQNSRAESLRDCYVAGRPRAEAYARMVARALSAVRAGRRVVVAFYGHPGVAADPSHAMLKQAREEGFGAQLLPGISADACLVADLGIDPLRPGWQSFEAWTFLARRPRFDPRFHLVLWQVGLIYERSISDPARRDPRGLRDLRRALGRAYTPLHRVVLYEASPFHVADPRIEWCPLRALPEAQVSTATTLLVPPRS